MMTPFGNILHDLRKLQAQLTSAGNTLWRLRLALQRAHQEGHQASDFLPRRLTLLQNEAQSQLEESLSELHQIAAKNLSPQFFVFHSPTEVKAFLKIKQTLRYLQNAYMDHSLRETLQRVNTQTL